MGIGMISGSSAESRGPANEWLCVLRMGILGFPEGGRSQLWRQLAVAPTRDIVLRGGSAEPRGAGSPEVEGGSRQGPARGRERGPLGTLGDFFKIFI